MARRPSGSIPLSSPDDDPLKTVTTDAGARASRPLPRFGGFGKTRQTATLDEGALSSFSVDTSYTSDESAKPDPGAEARRGIAELLGKRRDDASPSTRRDGARPTSRFTPGQDSALPSVEFLEERSLLSTVTPDTLAWPTPAVSLPGGTQAFEAGPSSRTDHVVIAPTGDKFAATGLDGTVGIYDLQSGKLLVPKIQVSPKPIGAIAFNPSGTELAVGAYDNTVYILDPASGNVLKSYPGFSNVIADLRYLDSTHLAVAAINAGADRVIDRTTGSMVSLSNAGNSVTVASSPDGTIVYDGENNGVVRASDAKTGATLRTYTGLTGTLYGLAASQDNTIIAGASPDGSLVIWDAKTAQPLQTINGAGPDSMQVQHLSFTPDSQELLVAYKGGRACAYRRSGNTFTINVDIQLPGVAYDVEATTSGVILAAANGTDTANTNGVYVIRAPWAPVVAPPTSPGSIAPTNPADSLQWPTPSGVDLGVGILSLPSMRATALSPDNRYLYVSKGTTVEVRDTVSSAVLSTLTLDGNVNGIAATSDGKLWLTINGAITKTSLKDVTTGQTLWEKPSDSYLNDLTATADGSLAASVAGRTISLLQRSGNSVTTDTITLTDNITHGLHFSPDRKTLAVPVANSLVLIDLATKGQTKIAGFRDWVTALAWSADSTMVVAGDTKGFAELIDTPTHQVMGTFQIPNNSPIGGLTFSPNQALVLSTDWNVGLMCWDITTAPQIHESSRSTGLKQVDTLQQSISGKTVLAQGADFLVAYHMPDAGQGAIVPRAKPLTPDQLASLIAQLTSLQTQQQPLIAQRDALLAQIAKIVPMNWPTKSSLPAGALGFINGQSTRTDQMAFSADGKLLATSGVDGSIGIWNTATGTLLRMVKVSTQLNLAVAFNPSGTELAVGTFDRTVVILNPTTGAILQTYSGFGNVVTGVSYTDDTHVAVAAIVPGDKIIDRKTGNMVTLSNGTNAGIVVASPDGKTVYNSEGSSVRSSDAVTGATLQSYPGLSSGVYGLTASKDGTLLAGGSGAGQVILWDPKTAQTLQVISTGSPTAGLSFSADSQQLIVGTYSGKVLYYQRNGAQFTLTAQSQVPGLVYDMKVGNGSVLVASNGSSSLANDGMYLFPVPGVPTAAQLQTQVTNLNGKIADIDVQVSTLKVQLNSQSSLQGQVETLYTQRGTLVSQRDALLTQTQTTSIIALLATLNGQIVATDNQIADLQVFLAQQNGQSIAAIPNHVVIPSEALALQQSAGTNLATIGDTYVQLTTRINALQRLQMLQSPTDQLTTGAQIAPLQDLVTRTNQLRANTLAIIQAMGGTLNSDGTLNPTAVAQSFRLDVTTAAAIADLQTLSSHTTNVQAALAQSALLSSESTQVWGQADQITSVLMTTGLSVKSLFQTVTAPDFLGSLQAQSMNPALAAEVVNGVRSELQDQLDILASRHDDLSLTDATPGQSLLTVALPNLGGAATLQSLPGTYPGQLLTTAITGADVARLLGTIDSNKSAPASVATASGILSSDYKFNKTFSVSGLGSLSVDTDNGIRDTRSGMNPPPIRYLTVQNGALGSTVDTNWAPLQPNYGYVHIHFNAGPTYVSAVQVVLETGAGNATISASDAQGNNWSIPVDRSGRVIIDHTITDLTLTSNTASYGLASIDTRPIVPAAGIDANLQMRRIDGGAAALDFSGASNRVTHVQGLLYSQFPADGITLAVYSGEHKVQTVPVNPDGTFDVKESGGISSIIITRTENTAPLFLANVSVDTDAIAKDPDWQTVSTGNNLDMALQIPPMNWHDGAAEYYPTQFNVDATKYTLISVHGLSKTPTLTDIQFYYGWKSASGVPMTEMHSLPSSYITKIDSQNWIIHPGTPITLSAVVTGANIWNKGFSGGYEFEYTQKASYSTAPHDLLPQGPMKLSFGTYHVETASGPSTDGFLTSRRDIQQQSNGFVGKGTVDLQLDIYNTGGMGGNVKMEFFGTGITYDPTALGSPQKTFVTSIEPGGERLLHVNVDIRSETETGLVLARITYPDGSTEIQQVYASPYYHPAANSTVRTYDPSTGSYKVEYVNPNTPAEQQRIAREQIQLANAFKTQGNNTEYTRILNDVARAVSGGAPASTIDPSVVAMLKSNNLVVAVNAPSLQSQNDAISETAKEMKVASQDYLRGLDLLNTKGDATLFNLSQAVLQAGDAVTQAAAFARLQTFLATSTVIGQQTAKDLVTGMVSDGQLQAALDQLDSKGVGGSSDQQFNTATQSVMDEANAIDRTQLYQNLFKLYTGPLGPKQIQIVDPTTNAVQTIYLRTDTVAGRICAGFMQQSPALVNDHVAILKLAAQIQSLTGVSYGALYGLVRFYNPDRFLAGVLKAFSDAGYKDLQVPTATQPLATQRMVNGVHIVDTTHVYKDEDSAIAVHFDLGFLPTDTSTSRLYDHVTATLLTSDGLPAAGTLALSDASFGVGRVGTYVSIPLSSIYTLMQSLPTASTEVKSSFKIKLNFFDPVTATATYSGNVISEAFTVDLTGQKDYSMTPTDTPANIDLHAKEREILSLVAANFPVDHTIPSGMKTSGWFNYLGSWAHLDDAEQAVDLNYVNPDPQKKADTDQDKPFTSVAGGTLSKIYYTTSIGDGRVSIIDVDSKLSTGSMWSALYMHMNMVPTNGQYDLYDSIWTFIKTINVGEEAAYPGDRLKSHDGKWNMIDSKGNIILTLTEGDTVKAKQQLGVIGKQGVTGYHLHFEAHTGGAWSTKSINLDGVLEDKDFAIPTKVDIPDGSQMIVTFDKTLQEWENLDAKVALKTVTVSGKASIQFLAFESGKAVDQMAQVVYDKDTQGWFEIDSSGNFLKINNKRQKWAKGTDGIFRFSDE